MNNTASRTHDNFFRKITRNKLNELLHRADENTNFLEGQINNKLLNSYCNTNIVLFKNTNTNKYECSIYINFYRKGTQIKIGHITLHLYPERKVTNKKYKSWEGRIHAKNNINKNRVFPFTIKRNNVTRNFHIFIEKRGLIRNELVECFDTGLNILNDYFDETSQFYLGNHLTPQSNTKHKYMNIIEKEFTPSKTPLRNTRKIYK